ncbi:hypothetical protein [Fibrella aquatilis]|uniref:Uncharacterized protein n=1 Tax=Fibrella aquatilis TaxID=2817059 RepID=A0A939G6S7_9BACT|nr:hypothetical protein [Fibrella aquatilis]MBO0931086.1 hypothetical protein [Fibrella aquatilis]
MKTSMFIAAVLLVTAVVYITVGSDKATAKPATDGPDAYAGQPEEMAYQPTPARFRSPLRAGFSGRIHGTSDKFRRSF